MKSATLVLLAALAAVAWLLLGGRRAAPATPLPKPAPAPAPAAGPSDLQSIAALVGAGSQLVDSISEAWS